MRTWPSPWIRRGWWRRSASCWPSLTDGVKKSEATAAHPLTLSFLRGRNPNMKGSPGNAFVVRTAWLAESNVWVWEMVDASSGEVTERSWPSHWAGYPSREGAEQAGVARLQEVAGPARVPETLSPPPAARGRDDAPAVKRQLGRSVL